MSSEDLINNYHQKKIENRNLNGFYGNSDMSNTSPNDQNPTNSENKDDNSDNETKHTTEENLPEKKRNNFPEKTNYVNNTFNLFANCERFDLNKIEALELFKRYDNYYFQTSIAEMKNPENQSIQIRRSNNFVPKAYDFNKKKPQVWLYYKMNLDDKICCTFFDRKYRLYKLSYTDDSKKTNYIHN